VSLIDTAPTLLDLAGIPAPSSYQGRSMLVAEPQMALFFADYSLGLLGLRDGPRKFIYEMESGRGRMFDLARDPGEARDISDSFRERANWYARDLRNWSAAQRIASTLAGRRAPD
jgi:arylsulfatase A-like enzyme